MSSTTGTKYVMGLTNNLKEKIGPFSDNPIMIGYDNRLFDFDPELGYVFPNNQIVGRVGFVEEEVKK